MVDAVKYPLLAPSILPESSKKCEVRHYSNRRRRLSGWRILGVFSIFFLQIVHLFAINVRINRFVAWKPHRWTVEKGSGKIVGKVRQRCLSETDEGPLPALAMHLDRVGAETTNTSWNVDAFCGPRLETANGATPELLEQHPMVHVLVAMHIIYDSTHGVPRNEPGSAIPKRTARRLNRVTED